MLIKEKVSQAISILKEMNIDCWMTFVRESQLNGDPILDFLLAADVTWHSALIVTSAGDTRAIVGLYDKKTVEDTGAYREVEGYVESIKKPLLEYLRKINPRTIAVNYSKDSEVCDGLTYGMYLTIEEYLTEIGFEKRLVSAEGVISALRQRKTKTEIEYMKEAIRITEDIFRKVAPFIAPGRTEHEIAEFMKLEVKKAGVELAWDPMMCPSVFTGPDTAGAHYNPTERKVERGHVLNMDFGVKYKGYCSDLQRTFYVLASGEQKAPPEVQKGFNTIVECIESSRKALKPGVKGNEVDTVSRSVLRTNGYEEFPHALGHQVGRFSHDGTALLGPAWEKYGRKPFLPLEEGMVFTIEPRLTVPDRGVATIEEMVLLTARGAEYISTPQKQLLLVRS
jgi:Xaa-Pro aminopeptidase